MTALRLRRADHGPAAGRAAAALESLLAQEGVETDIVVVGNGWAPEGLPDGVRASWLAGDDGDPGRAQRRACRASTASCCSSSTTTPRSRRPTRWRASRAFAATGAGLLQLRVEPRSGRRAQRDWVPRLRVGDPARSSDITVVWEGAVAIRRAVFEEVGGWPAAFRFVHEGVDLGWRVMDAGYRVALRGRHRRPAPVADGHAARVLATISGRATACGSRAATCRCRWASST